MITCVRERDRKSEERRGEERETDRSRARAQIKMGERKKVCVRILGRSVSIKVPKLRLFRKKVCSEPEWSWQAAPSPAPASSRATTPARTRPRQQHRYLSLEQVTNIQAWLTQLPKPGDVSQLDLVEEYLADLTADLSVVTASPPSQSIHTDIF